MDRSLALIDDHRQYKAYGDCFIVEFNKRSEKFNIIGASSNFVYYEFKSLEEASLKKDKMHKTMELLSKSTIQMTN